MLAPCALNGFCTCSDGQGMSVSAEFLKPGTRVTSNAVASPTPQEGPVSMHMDGARPVVAFLVNGEADGAMAVRAQLRRANVDI